MPRRTWTDDDLAEAVRTSRSLAQVMRQIGLRPGKYDYIRGHIERIGVDASHLRAMGEREARRPRPWSDDDLRRAVEASATYAQVMRALGYEPSGGIHRWLKAHVRALGLSTEHFTGQAWSRGKRLVSKVKRPLEEILVEQSTYKSAHLRRRLISEGVKDERCESCGLTSWLGSRLPLMLDHINGDHMDNRLANLRILCPNCHSLTPTWCAQNRRPA